MMNDDVMQLRLHPSQTAKQASDAPRRWASIYRTDLLRHDGLHGEAMMPLDKLGSASHLAEPERDPPRAVRSGRTPASHRRCGIPFLEGGTNERERVLGASAVSFLCDLHRTEGLPEARDRYSSGTSTSTTILRRSAVFVIRACGIDEHQYEPAVFFASSTKRLVASPRTSIASNAAHTSCAVATSSAQLSCHRGSGQGRWPHSKLLVGASPVGARSARRTTLTAA
eukprot:scaffold184_cov316-Pinguiococcus_pyrenoidosus.AAC.4